MTSYLRCRKLVEVEALIERAEEMRDWSSAATACGCATLDICTLFDARGLRPTRNQAVAAADMTADRYR
jgi:hypothetical protein